MKSNDLVLEELVKFSEGRIDFQGRRLVLHSIHAFAQLRRDLIEMMGLERARRILTRFGYFWGQADAAAMKRVFEWDSLTEWLKAGLRMQSLQGVSKGIVKSMEYDPDQGKFEIDVVWHYSVEAQEYLTEFGKSEDPVCRILTGYASGYTSFCVGKNIYYIEQRCMAKGDRVCSAMGKDEDSWGDELEKQLLYFQAEDIQGKIQTLTRELRQKSRELALERMKSDPTGPLPNPSLIEVQSKSFRQVLDLAARVAPFDTSVLITGESGVGKEVLARHIHRLSHRAEKPFVAVNCGALPETLLESELFGHVKGSFTGASQDRVGLFEQAHQGTLFLDEIGDISPGMQMKLLRVLQSREIMRVGESKTRKVDVRILAATNQNLPQAIEAGQFREDLYYRLRVIEIEIPPLRERVMDILPLARYFVKKFSKKLNLPNLRLDATCLEPLQSYGWPGNIRELENAIERAAVLSRNDVVYPESLLPSIVRSASSIDQMNPLTQTLAQVETIHIERVLKLLGGNRTRTAKVLGISPATLWRKLKKDHE